MIETSHEYKLLKGLFHNAALLVTATDSSRRKRAQQQIEHGRKLCGDLGVSVRLQNEAIREGARAARAIMEAQKGGA